MQISLFDGNCQFKIDKPIRLIELFAGYGSQHFALKYLGASAESWKICEWAVKSIQAYKDAHFAEDNTDYSAGHSFEFVVNRLFRKGISSNYNEPMTKEQIKRMGEQKCRTIYNNIKATHNLVNIQQARGEDLQIVDIDKYCYVLTYSFPCQDLSLAGLGAGMAKNSGTRSGMLWEVERILDEIVSGGGHLPQVLLMENVPEVKGSKNIKHFASWVQKLESLGYYCKWAVLNAKDYGVPQNRERCFMVSILGNDCYYYYDFPTPRPLDKRLKDILENNVDEKYYLSDRALSGSLNSAFNSSKLENRLPKSGVMPTLCARDYKDPKCVQVAQMEGSYESTGRVYSPNGLAPTINTCGGGNREPKIIDDTYGYGGDRVYENCPTIRAEMQGLKVLEQSLKRQLCNKLIQDKLVKEGDVIRHSYSSNRLTNGAKNMGRIESKEHLSPTLDTRCDCLGIVVNNNPKCLGGIGEKKSNGGTQYYQQNRIYSADSVAMCHPANVPSGSYMYAINEPTICASRGRNPQNPSSRVAGEPTEQRIEINKSGCSNTLTTVQKDNYLIEPRPLKYVEQKLLETIKKNGGELPEAADLYNSRPINNGIAGTLSTSCGNDCGCGSFAVINDYRIRKLTPKECFRLMGVKDKDFEKIAQNQSNASLYHLAGDSIVVDVLMAIFKQML